MDITRRGSKPGFTLIELLIVIAIISVLIGVLVPTITRSLSSNKLSSDVDVMRSKIEETRLLAGSTQTSDTLLGEDRPDISRRVGYYGVFLPTQSDILLIRNKSRKPFYAIVRLSKPLTIDEPGYCTPDQARLDALDGIGNCLVERVDLTTNVSFVTATIDQERVIGFTTPTQQVVELYRKRNCSGDCWVENPSGPKFDQKANGQPYYFALKYNNKTASINVEPYTGKLQVTYK